MKVIRFQIGVTLDGEAVTTLARLLEEVIEKGTARHSQKAVRAKESAGVEEPGEKSGLVLANQHP